MGVIVDDRRDRLRQQAILALADSGGWSLVITYPALTFCLALAAEVWETKRWLVTAVILLTAAVGVVRELLAQKIRTSSLPRMLHLRKMYAGSVVLLAGVWASYGFTLIVQTREQSWGSFLVVLTTVGLVAASAFNLHPYLPLLLAYLFTTMLPLAVALLLHGGLAEALTAALILVFCFFISSIGRRNSRSYQGFSQALLDLEEARASQEVLLRRWRSVVENAPDIILLVDRELKVEFINRTEGPYAPEDLVGHPLAEFMPADEVEQVVTHLQDVLATGRSAYYTTRAISPEGEILGVYDSRAGALWVNEQVESVVIIASNVSARQAMEEELRHSRRQLRQLAARQEAALEEERRRISREVHDQLGQLLTALKIDLGWMLSRLDEGPLAERAQAMNEVVDATMANVRTISRRLRPPILDELGLVSALDWLLEDVLGRAGLQYRLDSPLAGRFFDPEASLSIFRVCQEALTNVLRHAQARFVEVELKCETEFLRLRIADDGVGISSEQVASSLGLLGLRERVHLLEGKLSILGQPGQGTEIVVEIPLRRALKAGV